MRVELGPGLLETVVAGVPVLTWPMVYEQFITERFLTEVLEIGDRLWPEGAGRGEEHQIRRARANSPRRPMRPWRKVGPRTATCAA